MEHPEDAYAKWTRRFLELAGHIAQWSKDPSTRVGAVIVNRDRVIIGTGYNGFPRNVVDSPELYEDREAKYARTMHAETNAILNASVPLAFAGAVMYCTHAPCNECAKHIIQAGIRQVHSYRPSDDMISRWGKSFNITRDMFMQADVKLYFHDHPVDHPFVKMALTPPGPGLQPGWDYYAAHYLIGSNLIEGDLPGHIRSLAHELRQANERDKPPLDRRV